MVDIDNRGWLSPEQVVQALRLFGMYVTVEEVLTMAEELLEIDELHQQQQKMMQSDTMHPSEHTWRRKSVAASAEGTARRGFGESSMARSMTLRPTESSGDHQFDFDDEGLGKEQQQQPQHSSSNPTGHRRSKASVSIEERRSTPLPSPSHKLRKAVESKKQQVCIHYEMFEQLIRLWQGAARYRLFQDRGVESRAHMDSALNQVQALDPGYCHDVVLAGMYSPVVSLLFHCRTVHAQ